MDAAVDRYVHQVMLTAIGKHLTVPKTSDGSYRGLVVGESGALGTGLRDMLRTQNISMEFAEPLAFDGLIRLSKCQGGARNPGSLSAAVVAAYPKRSQNDDINPAYRVIFNKLETNGIILVYLSSLHPDFWIGRTRLMLERLVRSVNSDDEVIKESMLEKTVDVDFFIEQAFKAIEYEYVPERVPSTHRYLVMRKPEPPKQ